MATGRLLSSASPLARVHPAALGAAALLVLYPSFASSFFVFQIGAYSLILGTIALSELLQVAGKLARQIQDVPDGGQIILDITD